MRHSYRLCDNIYKVMKRKMNVMAATGIFLLGMTFLSGCGEETTTYTQTGMDEVVALNYDAAMEDFAQALENGEDERLILRGQGLVYLAQQNFDSAIDCFKQSLMLSDGVPTDLDFDINYYLAAAYYKSGMLPEAKNVYDAILTLRKDEANAYYLRGVVLMESGQMDAAMTDFNHAMDLRDGDYDLVLDIYQVMSAQGYRDAGRDMLSACVASHSDMSDYDLGRFEYYLSNYESAKSYLEQADKGESADITLYLGRTYEALGDYNYAISLYNTYLDKDHNDPEIYNQMGLCQMKMERYSEALGSFQAGMTLEDTSILQTLKFNEIVAYEYMQEYQTAAILMKEYIGTYPDDTAAAREYIFLKSR